jgi:renalase
MIDFCILGSGIAGSTISNLLSKRYKIIVFDKAKGAGGRASNRRYKNKLSFDHGLQYISPENEKYNQFIIKLKKGGILKIWEGDHLDFSLNYRKEKLKYIGKKANNDISKYLLKGIKTNFSSPISKIKFENNYWNINILNKKIYSRNIILTCPFPQVIPLANKYLNNEVKKMNIKMTPNITVLAVFKNSNIPISSFKFNNKILAWASNENSKKRFNTNLNLWTIQASSEYSKRIINNYKDKKEYFSSCIIKEFLKITGFEYKHLIFKSIHGWKYSYNQKPTSIKSYWSKKYNLGVCGDWFVGPKAESAWISAHDLFKKIKNR